MLNIEMIKVKLTASFVIISFTLNKQQELQKMLGLDTQYCLRDFLKTVAERELEIER